MIIEIIDENEVVPEKAIKNLLHEWQLVLLRIT